MDTHLCFLFPLSLSNSKFRARIDKKRGEYCFFDLEAMKLWDEKKDRFIFVPYLIVFQFEDGEERVFLGENCLKEFAEFLFKGENN